MTQMESSLTVLFRDGPFSLWFRVPALAFGLFALYLSIALLADNLFGVSLGLDQKGSRGSSLLASIGCLIIALVWIFTWFAQLQLLFDAAQQKLIVRTRGFFRYHDHSISLVGCREIQIYEFRGWKGGTSWRVRVIFVNGQSEYVTEIPENIIPEFTKAVSEATKLQVNRHAYTSEQASSGNS